ncbi:MAG: DUF2069 domain-containing protein [Burkholderiaceae bacterium]|nr:DUF2069 domain-containing protein [Burkholderiaceae bacterium]
MHESLNHQPQSSSAYHRAASASLLALIVLLIAWEMLLAPLHPGGSWLVLKVIPLLIPLRGVLKHDNYTLQWSSMFILLYFTEGVVRAVSDTLPLSRILAGLEILLTCSFFFCSLSYLRPYKKAAKLAAKLAASKHSI